MARQSEESLIMPDVTYSPTQGRVSSVSAEERLAQDQRDFLFRNQMAQRAAQMEEQRRSDAQGALSAQERMNSANLANQLQVNGDFASRTGAARDLASMANEQASKLEGQRSGTQLEAARIGAGPGMAALGMQERAYNDSRNDRQNDPEYIGKQMMADALRGGPAPASSQSAMASVGPTSNGTMPANHPADQSGKPTTATESFVTPTQGSSPLPERGGMMPGSFGKDGKQYEYDQGSEDSQRSMMEQLRGQVPRERLQQLQDQVNNSSQQAEQRRSKIEEVKAALVQAAAPAPKGIANPGDPSLNAGQPNALAQRYLNNMIPESAAEKEARATTHDNRAGEVQFYQTMAQSQDPKMRAQGIQGLQGLGMLKGLPADFVPPNPAGPLGDLRNTMAQSAEGTALVEQSPTYQDAKQRLEKAATAGDTEGFIMAAAEMKKLLTDANVPAQDVQVLVRKAMQDVAPSEAADFGRNVANWTGVGNVINAFSEGDALPGTWRQGIRDAAKRGIPDKSTSPGFMENNIK